MREFESRIVDPLANGLRPSPRLGVNSPYLTDCINLKPTIEGLVSCENVQVPFSPAPTVSFPFPQLFKGKGVTLLADKTNIYIVDESDWTKEKISLTGTITQGGMWHFVDMFDYWILLNGTTSVYKSGIHMLDGSAPKMIATDSPTIQTGCYLNGRTVMGGFGSDFWADPQWQHMIEEWQESLSPSVVIEPSLGQNFVLWSSIGGGDVMWVFDPNLALSGIGLEDDPTATGPRIFESLKRNEMGFMPMPWQGTVRVVKPLGNAVMVYGDDGISAIIQTSEPIPTFGQKHLLDFGVAGRGAVGGTNREHVFVDEAGYLWRIGVDLVPKRLNYHEFVQSMTIADIVISHDQGENEYYICDGSSNYILTSKGLGKTGQSVTSIVSTDGAMLGISRTSREARAWATIETIDFNLRSIKTLATVEVGLESSADCEVIVACKYAVGGDFTTLPAVAVNPEGTAYIGASGIEFRVTVRASSFSNTEPKISYLNLRWKLSDKRLVRGIYAASAST